MRPQTTRRDHIDTRQHGGITWRGVVAAYGVMMLVVSLIWAISYPTVAATVFALVAGASVAIWVGMLIIRRQARHTICIPGMDVCFTI